MPVETFGALPLALVSIANNEGRYLILGFDFLVFFFFFKLFWCFLCLSLMILLGLMMILCVEEIDWRGFVFYIVLIFGVIGITTAIAAPSVIQSVVYWFVASGSNDPNITYFSATSGNNILVNSTNSMPLHNLSIGKSISSSFLERINVVYLRIQLTIIT